MPVVPNMTRSWARFSAASSRTAGCSKAASSAWSKAMAKTATCRCPSASWRKKTKSWDDKKAAYYLRWTWVTHGPKDKRTGPPYGQLHHDWAQLRALCLREARRRGLDI